MFFRRLTDHKVRSLPIQPHEKRHRSRNFPVCASRSLGEFGATITFASNIRGQTQTLPLALYTLTQVPDGEMGAMRLCIISMLIAMAALVCSEILARRFAARLKG